MNPKPYFTLFLLCLALHPGIAQTCLSGTHGFLQADIDSFAIRYPGCTTITGNLVVGSEDLTNLEGLAQLKRINGYFFIENAQNLASLSGLDSLTRVGSLMRIAYCDELTDLSGLDALTYVGGNLEINQNELLASLEGLGSLASVQQILFIYRNHELKDLSGLEGLRAIGDNLSVTDNDGLLSLSGLDSLKEVRGAVWINENDSLSALAGINNLATIGEDLNVLKNPFLTSLVGLDSLSDIGGGLNVDENGGLADFTGLENLSRIGGSLILRYFDGLVGFTGLEKLNRIGGTFDASFCPDLVSLSGLGNLKTIGSFLKLEDNDALPSLSGLDSLSAIGSYCIINGNEVLADLNGLEQLASIGDRLELRLNPALADISGLQSLVSVGDRLVIQFNFALANLAGLESLRTVGGNASISSNAPLTDISSLAGLVRIGGSLGLESIGGTDLSGLRSLASVGGDLNIGACPELTSLSGLDNLRSIGGAIQIGHNPELTTLFGIHNIAPGSIQNQSMFADDIKIQDNPLLSQCAIASICGALMRDDTRADFSGNAMGCNSEAELDCINFGISGKLYYDFNQNQQQDADEVNLPGLSVSFLPVDEEAVSNQEGLYYYFGEPDTTYTFSPAPDPDWILTTAPASYTIPFIPGNPINHNNDFGLIPTFSRHEGSINLSAGPTRCNENTNFYLRCENSGTFAEKGRIQLHYDPGAGFVSADPAPDEVNAFNRTISWNYDTLTPFQQLNYRVLLSMPNETATGSLVTFSAEMFGDDAGAPVLLDRHQLYAVVLCSYDPNDKLVTPPGAEEEGYTFHDEKLTYTIRFQNTGNAEAINIKIIDTLDADLDLASFKVVNSSFPVQTTLKGQEVEFYFINIHLPDSLSNEPASHGFVTYEIAPAPGLADYTEIENTAHIIFDFNPPIVTNTTLNTMVTMLPVATHGPEEGRMIRVHPNPASASFTLTVNGNQHIETLLIYDALGRLVHRGAGLPVPVSDWIPGLYFLCINTGDKWLVEKLVVE